MKKNNHLIVNMLDRELYNMMGTLQKKKKPVYTVLAGPTRGSGFPWPNFFIFICYIFHFCGWPPFQNLRPFYLISLTTLDQLASICDLKT